MHYSRMLTDSYSGRYQMSVPGTGLLSGPMFFPGGFCSGGGSLSRGFSLSGGVSLPFLLVNRQTGVKTLPSLAVGNYTFPFSNCYLCALSKPILIISRSELLHWWLITSHKVHKTILGQVRFNADMVRLN